MRWVTVPLYGGQYIFVEFEIEIKKEGKAEQEMSRMSYTGYSI